MDCSKPKITTMSHLSKAIGVSRPTLSRYFQDPLSVRASTSDKIRARLEDVDYVYNFIATRQNRKRSGLIGVVIPHYSDLFFTTLLEVIERAARDMGFTIITQSSDGEVEIEVEALQRLRSMNVDGAIIAPLGLQGSQQALVAARQDFPIVFVDSHPEGDVKDADFVGTDNALSVACMVEYLCRIGSPPVFLGMPDLNTNAAEREAAYLTKMRQLGNESHIIRGEGAVGSWQFEAYGFAVMDHHFGRQTYTSSAVLCANDRIAIGAIRAANKHGLFAQGAGGQPRVRIAGHDDHPLSQFIHPAVTTVAQDIDGIGEDAVRLLVDRVQGRAPATPVRMLKGASLRPRESA